MSADPRIGPDARSRLDYLAHTLELLWPDAGRADTPDRVVLPSAATPRLLVPARERRATAAAVLRYTAQQGPRDRAKAVALAAAVGAGLTRRLAPRTPTLDHGGESIDTHLGAVLGQDVVTVLALTRDRPNRKPVLQVFDRAGRCLAWAKIGTTPLSIDLVDAEAASLNLLGAAGLTRLTVPPVLHHGRWRGHPLLVLGDLGRGTQVRAGDHRLLAAMRELSAGAGGTYNGYLAGLRERAERAGQLDTEWARLLDDVVGTGVEPTMGAWHGDWTQWNCAQHGGRLLVWDLERFSAPAPVGFDALHYRLNVEVEQHRDRFRAASSRLVTRARELLRSFGVGPAEARVTALLYVLDIALRYVADGAAATDPAGDVRRWAYPTVRTALPRAAPGGTPR